MLLLCIYESACERTAYMESLRTPQQRHSIKILRSCYIVHVRCTIISFVKGILTKSIHITMNITITPDYEDEWRLFNF